MKDILYLRRSPTSPRSPPCATVRCRALFHAGRRSARTRLRPRFPVRQRECRREFSPPDSWPHTQAVVRAGCPINRTSSVTTTSANRRPTKRSPPSNPAWNRRGVSVVVSTAPFAPEEFRVDLSVARRTARGNRPQFLYGASLSCRRRLRISPERRLRRPTPYSRPDLHLIARVALEHSHPRL